LEKTLLVYRSLFEISVEAIKNNNGG